MPVTPGRMTARAGRCRLASRVVRRFEYRARPVGGIPRSMQPRVVLRVSSPNRRAVLAHGDLVGRLRHCALLLDDARISEAHALVSLRGDGLQLLPLRGRVWRDGQSVKQLRLEPGLRFEFASGLECVVEEIVLPESVPGVLLDGVGPLVLAGTTSLVVDAGRLALRAGWVAGASAWAWCTGDEWRLQRRGDEAVHTLCEGSRFVFPEGVVECAWLPLVDASIPPTRAEPERAGPVKLIARYQSVHLFHSGHEVLVLDGPYALIVSELVALGGPATWEVVAREVWRDCEDVELLRSRWDTALHRLRARLKAVGLRSSMIRSDRRGFVELVLGPHDEVVNQT